MKRIILSQAEHTEMPFVFAFWQSLNAGKGSLNKNAVINIYQKWQFLNNQNKQSKFSSQFLNN